MSNKQDLAAPSRREFLASTGAMTLCAAGILLLAWHDVPAQSMGGVIPAFQDAQLAKVAGRLAADETMHWTVLNRSLGRPLPGDALPFGM